MAMNKYMHPRNPYKKAPDFLQMTLDYPDLRKYVKTDLSGKVKMNFKCEGAVRELTKCLLHKDFGLNIELPPDRLVPTLPLRMNYLLWIEDLLNESDKHLHGVDIGTGASCIYPLLASKHFNWRMTATEIDAESITYAMKNVYNNNLKHLIEVKTVKDNIMLDGALEDNITYDFCMCNPPFYSDESEIVGKARTDRRAPPRNHLSGQHFELIAPGGETAFISRIIEDSVKLKCKVRVYTVMVGHKSNLSKVKEMVKQLNPVRMRTTEFCQGRTTRWGLAWTFSNESNLINTAIQPRKEQSKPPFRWVYPGECDIETLKSQVLDILNNLHITVNEIGNDDRSCDLCLKAFENTWAHSRRKRREEDRKLIQKQAASPCDSVVTTNDSVDSNNPLSPSSPVDSLGYSSCDDTDNLSNIYDQTVLSTTVSNTGKSKEMKSNCTDDNLQTKHQSDRPCSSSQINERVIDNTEILCTVKQIIEEKPSSKEELSQNVTMTPGKRRSDQQTGTLNKKMKCSERPLIEALLVISEFDNDLILSLSFIDGTGGREAANQVFQYLKNKLSS